MMRENEKTMNFLIIINKKREYNRMNKYTNDVKNLHI